jgi:hypothetical protein
MKSQTHSPARVTSAACAGSALIDGIAKSPDSSSNQLVIQRAYDRSLKRAVCEIA